MTFTQRLKHCLTGVTVTMLLAVSCSANCQTTLPLASDLALDAIESGRTGAPLIVMFSLPGCPHCEVVRRSHLLPLLRDQTALPRPIVRQIDITSALSLRDFDGSKITHAEFAARQKIKLAPVVMFFGRSGEMLAKPLVGSMIPDFYGAYLDAALTEARTKLVP
ncbi:MAG: hypothetical protein ABI583_08775 [Betaproteobacteria bacterium]